MAAAVGAVLRSPLDVVLDVVQAVLVRAINRVLCKARRRSSVLLATSLDTIRTSVRRRLRGVNRLNHRLAAAMLGVDAVVAVNDSSCRAVLGNVAAAVFLAAFKDVASKDVVRLVAADATAVAVALGAAMAVDVADESIRGWVRACKGRLASVRRKDGPIGTVSPMASFPLPKGAGVPEHVS